MNATTESEQLKAIIAETEEELAIIQEKVNDDWATEDDKARLLLQVPTLENRIKVARLELAHLVKSDVEEKQVKATEESVKEASPPAGFMERYEFDRNHGRVATSVQRDLVLSWAISLGYSAPDATAFWQGGDKYSWDALDDLALRIQTDHNNKRNQEHADRLAELRQEIVIKENWTPETKEDFEWVVDKMLAAEAALERRKERWKEDEKELQRSIDNLNYLYFAQLTEFCQKECESSGKKTVKFTTGKFTFTKQNAGFILDSSDINKLGITREISAMPADVQAKLKIESVTAWKWADIKLIKEFAESRKDKNNKPLPFGGFIYKEADEWGSPKVKA